MITQNIFTQPVRITAGALNSSRRLWCLHLIVFFPLVPKKKTTSRVSVTNENKHSIVTAVCTQLCVCVCVRACVQFQFFVWQSSRSRQKSIPLLCQKSCNREANVVFPCCTIIQSLSFGGYAWVASCRFYPCRQLGDFGCRWVAAGTGGRDSGPQGGWRWRMERKPINVPQVFHKWK